MQISSVDHDVPFKFELHKNDPIFSTTGLSKTSYFYIKNVKLIPKSKIGSYRGQIHGFTAWHIANELKLALNMIPP